VQGLYNRETYQYDRKMPQEKLKIYIASSWKNAGTVRELANLLRENGHMVFDFTDSHTRESGLDKFCFNIESWSGEPLETIDWLDFLLYSATEKAFKSDKAGIDWADVLILIVPSGRSSHLEAGYIVGCGKLLYIWGDLPKGEFDTMYKFATGCYRSKELPDLLKILKTLKCPKSK